MSLSTVRNYSSTEPGNAERNAAKFPPASFGSGSEPTSHSGGEIQDQAATRVIEIAVSSEARNAGRHEESAFLSSGRDERLLNAREVAATLGVSERWVRDHTTRRFPKIRGVKLGTLIRYRRADIEFFMRQLDTLAPSRRP